MILNTCFNEALGRTRSLRRKQEVAGPSEDVKSKASDSLKRKIYSINANVKPQPEQKVGSGGGDPEDSAKQERLRRAKKKQVGGPVD